MWFWHKDEALICKVNSMEKGFSTKNTIIGNQLFVTDKTNSEHIMDFRINQKLPKRIYL